MPFFTNHTGLTTPNEHQIVARPRTVPTNPVYPIMYTHGAGGSADIHLNYGMSALRTNNLAENGVLGVSGDYGGPQTWGNTAAMNALTDSYNWLQTQPGVKPGKVAISGGSMGGLNALVWAAANRDKVSCLSIYIPVINLTDIWSNNRSGFQSTIDSCYGGAYNPSSMQSFKSPWHIADSGIYKDLPILINYGANDPLCLPNFVTEFAAKVGPNVIIHSRNGGHDQTTENAVDRAEEVNFILSHSR